jgi:hypothetical protein
MAGDKTATFDISGIGDSIEVLNVSGITYKNGNYVRPERPDGVLIILWTKDGVAWTAKWTKMDIKKKDVAIPEVK